MDLKIGDILAVKGNGLISEAIEAVEHSQYSHIAGYVGNGQLIEAEGFRKTGYALLSKYKGIADVFGCDEATDYQRQQMLKLAQWNIGGHYDYVLLGIELVRYELGVWLPYKEVPKIRVCSTLWAGIYRDVGLDKWKGIKYPSPGDIPKPLRYKGSI
ncbi:hypothetical protein [Desulfosporosinus sp. SB140]|uniref:hypothetical protein n=1 Tax=Desulfosporosinus paludis TaxID=3115649 RepID=UPI00389104C3